MLKVTRLSLIAAAFVFSVLFSFFGSFRANAGIPVEEYQMRVVSHKEVVRLLCPQYISRYKGLKLVPVQYLKTFEAYVQTRCDRHDNSKQGFAKSLAQNYGVTIKPEEWNGQQGADRRALNQGINRVDKATAVQIGDEFFGSKLSREAKVNIFDSESPKVKRALRFALNSKSPFFQLAPSEIPEDIRSIVKSPGFMERYLIELGDELEHIVDTGARNHEIAVNAHLHKNHSYFPNSDGTVDFGRKVTPTSDYLRDTPIEKKTYGDWGPAETEHSARVGHRIERMSTATDYFEIHARDETTRRLIEAIEPNRLETEYRRIRGAEYRAPEAAADPHLQCLQRALSGR